MLALTVPAGATTSAAPLDLTKQVVRVCDDANEWPPYTYWLRENGRRTDRLTGYSTELIRLIASRRGLRLQIEMLPWKRCLESVRSGETLLLLNAIATPERRENYWLSSSIYETRLLALWSRSRHPDGLALPSQADLLPLRIGGLQGYSYSQLDQIPESRLIRAPNYDSLLQMLHLGRVDVALVNEGVMLGYAALGNPGFSRSSDLGVSALEYRAPSSFYMMATKARAEGRALMDLINQELELMSRSGELTRLRETYLQPSEAKRGPKPATSQQTKRP
jgi:polar amino acid transport system substrate-binding protein